MEATTDIQSEREKDSLRDKILTNIDNPEQLEKLYRLNKQNFSKEIAGMPADNPSDLIRFWKIRLDIENENKRAFSSKTDISIVVLLAVFTGLLVKIPSLFPQIDQEFFYTRNLALIVFNSIILYTFWQNRIFDIRKILFYVLSVSVIILFVNLLPGTEGDSVMLSLIHVPILLWCLFGLTFVSFDHNNAGQRIEFIRFNGEFITMTGLILIAGIIFSGVTISLFSVIDISIEGFYMENIALTGVAIAPIVSLYLIRLYPDITRKIAPVIARVFTPLVLVTLIIYLVSLIFSENKIMEDRELLLLFNIMLLAVMGIIVFSVSEINKSRKRDLNVLVLFLLAVLATVINTIALISIISRLTGGFTPNRTVVLGLNILVFFNLVLIATNLFASYFTNHQLESVERTVARYLPVYIVWTVVVVFILPFVFGFD
jgi:hypothetical protein